MKYVAYWDCLGFECIVDMTSWEKDCLLQQIKGEPPNPAPVSLRHLVLRAQFNPQRFPEIWIFEIDMEQEDLWQLGQDDPQLLVDAIRKNGHNVFKTPKEKSVIK